MIKRLTITMESLTFANLHNKTSRGVFESPKPMQHCKISADVGRKHAHAYCSWTGEENAESRWSPEAFLSGGQDDVDSPGVHENLLASHRTHAVQHDLRPKVSGWVFNCSLHGRPVFLEKLSEPSRQCPLHQTKHLREKKRKVYYG
jgi:hypothetical protein